MGQPFQKPSLNTDNQIRINASTATPEAEAALRQIATHLSAHPSPNQADLDQHLALLTQLASLNQKATVQPSTLPIIGGLITRVKQALHALILFYLNDLAAQQSAFNHQLVQTLRELAHADGRPPRV